MSRRRDPYDIANQVIHTALALLVGYILARLAIEKLGWQP